MTVDQKPREVFRIAKQRVEEKEDVVAVTCHKDESGAGESKCGLLKENLEGAHGNVDEC